MKHTPLVHRLRRKRKIRAKIRGTAARPRMTVFRSHMQIAVQVIDDEAGKTIIAASTAAMKAKPTMDGAKKLGLEIAKMAKEKKIDSVIFDRNAYKYHGRVKALADAAREGGLQF